LDARFDGLEERMHESFTAVEDRLELVENRVDGMDKRFDCLEGKVDSNHLLR
jgi:hypothetical protein